MWAAARCVAARRSAALRGGAACGAAGLAVRRGAVRRGGAARRYGPESAAWLRRRASGGAVWCDVCGVVWRRTWFGDAPVCALRVRRSKRVGWGV